MLKTARQTQIRRLVEVKGQVTVTELNALLDVSEATIRRDLEQMAEMGLVQRTHGGAVRLEPTGSELPIRKRISENAGAKRQIGHQAARLIHEGQTIFLGSGSTVQEITPHILDIPGLTVITNSLPVITQLAASPVELVVIGGLFRKSELSMVGHVAEQALREFRADTVFMGMPGIDPHHGFTSDYLPEAMTDRTIMDIARRLVIVADHSKFGRVNSVFLAPATAAQTIITDKAAPPDTIAELRAMGVEVQLV